MKWKMFKDASPPGFVNPTALPADEFQQQTWQQQNRDWWQKHSMRYDFSAPIPYEEFSKEFYAEIDKRFYASASRYAPSKSIPFDFFIDFPSLRTKDVLEIGCGNGSHAQLLAAHAKSYTGIDLTEYAMKSTSTRLALFDLKATVLQMDAEQMQFPDNSFDFIWTWGVIHHSANTHSILKEMNRVLRPGGRAKVMVYYRGFWCYYVLGAVVAVLSGRPPTLDAIHECNQLLIDGGLARYYRPAEWRQLVGGLFRVERIGICGPKEALIFLPGGKLKRAILRIVPNWLTRFLAAQCRMGNFLIAEMEKI